MSKATKTALVTGANAGIGFETAAQLADDGWGTVILACRSIKKAEDAAARLRERTGRDPFAYLAVDTSEIDSANAAADELKSRGNKLDVLILNAGASGKDPRFNSAGVEITYASTLVGHYVLTMRLLADGLLADGARIVIAGSEGARGNMPGMGLHDINALADASFGGDKIAAMEALSQLKAPIQKSFNNMQEYVTAKLIVAWWTAAVARRLPAGMAINAVSPGAVLDTSFARDAPAMMKMVMMPMMKLLGPLMGMNGPIEPAARRYLDVADYGADKTGGFYATANPKKFVGPIGLQETYRQFFDEAGQEASLDFMIKLTGIGLPAQVAQAASA